VNKFFNKKKVFISTQGFQSLYKSDGYIFLNYYCFSTQKMRQTRPLCCVHYNLLDIFFCSEYRRLFDRVVALTHLNLRRLDLGSETWGAQFREAMSVNGGDIENATTLDYVMHFLTFAWKVCSTLFLSFT